MTEINREITQKTAQLARLELSQTELSQFTDQLAQIVHYVEQLQAVQTQGVAPMTHPFEEGGFLRPDASRNSQLQDRLLAEAAETLHRSFKVPPVL